MARRASSRETIEVPGASHVVMISHPEKVAAMIKRASTSR
jgi:pimeloyl-ACP methyl ester carboxylesterase